MNNGDIIKCFLFYILEVQISNETRQLLTVLLKTCGTLIFIIIVFAFCAIVWHTRS